MTIIQSVVLGIVQGLTEFLPVSSDGHLAVVYHFLGSTPDLAFEVFLHAATLIAMVVYFRADIWRLLSALFTRDPARKADRRLVGLIVIATAISGALALLLGPIVQPASESLTWVGIGFLVTAALLVLGERLAKPSARVKQPHELGIAPTGFIGVLQGLAVLPGVSRSGSTIAAGMATGLSREQAARFSFLLGIPIISLAAAKDGLDIFQGHAALPGLAPSIVGFLCAGVAGYLAIAGLLALVRKHSLYWFAAYTAVLGTAMLLLDTVFRG